MTYSANADVELAFGRSNVRKWADLNNTNLQAEIDDRMEWAREQAYDELNSRLASSRYQFPLAGTTFPAILVRMEAYLAGVLLYESRGVTDVGEDGKAQHALMWHRKRVDEFIRDVHGKRIELLGAELSADADAVGPITTTMLMISFDDPSPSRSVPRLEDNMIDIPTDTPSS